MMLSTSFEDACVIASAYNLDFYEEWVSYVANPSTLTRRLVFCDCLCNHLVYLQLERPIYHQAIVRGNLRFAEAYLGARTYSSTLWLEMAGRVCDPLYIYALAISISRYLLLLLWLLHLVSKRPTKVAEHPIIQELFALAR
jgi:hypothetical protein